MTRTQISLSDGDRALLDAESVRTGTSISSLIREAIHCAYGRMRSTADDLAAMRSAFGSWGPRDEDSAAFVDGLRSGARLSQ
jgi:ribbon-helix-helix CopG family protein